MAIPILVNDVLGGCFADSAEPLRAIGRHPNEIAGRDRMPAISQPVNAASAEHEQTVFHDVYLNHGERGAGLKGHQVESEIE
jgi:hypothetical protein